MGLGNEINTQLLRPGDLIFLLCDGTEFSRAITDVSAPKLRLDHVGVLDSDGKVIEANSRMGVVATPLAEFLARAPEVAGDHGWRTARIKSSIDIAAALRRARSFIGMAYNWKFLPTPDALYCSELVQRAFLLADGSCLFPSIHMDFRGADGSVHPFWKRHFAALGMAVPQGREGTSPLSIYEFAMKLTDN